VLGKLGIRQTVGVLHDCAPKLADLPIVIEVANPHGWSAGRLSELLDLHQPSLVVLDSMVDHPARDVAHRHHVPILWLSDVECQPQGPLGQGDPERLVAAGGESAADCVLVLAREQGGAMWLAIAWQRVGGGGWAKLDFDGSRFTQSG
jgi:hypothetical protein